MPPVTHRLRLSLCYRDKSYNPEPKHLTAEQCVTRRESKRCAKTGTARREGRVNEGRKRTLSKGGKKNRWVSVNVHEQMKEEKRWRR